MDQVAKFFTKLFESSDWPARWHCGKWSEFHGWLYIISDLLIWSAYFTIPLVILRYITKKQKIGFMRLYILFAAFILACGATHFLDAAAFWVPMYRLNALFLLITGVLSWITVFHLIKYLPLLFSLKTQQALAVEIEHRKRSEEKFRGLLEAAPDSIIITNENGQIILINEQTEKLFGYTKTELLNKPVETLIPGDLHSKHISDRVWYHANPKVRAMGAGLELYALRKNGTQFPVEISLSPLVTDEGTLISASVRDITNRKKAEEDLNKFNQELIISRKKIEESEERFRNVIEQAINPILILKGEDLKLELANVPLFKLWNIGKESIGRPFLEILPEMEGQPFHELLMDVLHNGTTHFGTEESTYLIRENGEKEMFYFNFVYSPYRENDNTISGVIVQANDVSINVISRKKIEVSEKKLLIANSELAFQIEEKEKNEAKLRIANQELSNAKNSLRNSNEKLEQRVKERTEDVVKSEQRFRSMIENNNDFINVTDQTYKIVYRSPSAYRITGWTNDEIVNSPPYKHVHPDDREKAAQIIRDTLANPGKPINAILRMLHKNGQYIWLEGVVTNLLNDANVNGFVSNYHDVTERVYAEEKLIESEKLYRSLFENMLNGFAYCKAIFDGDKLVDYLYIAVNDEYETLTGLKNITGKKMSELMPDLLDSDPVYIEVLKKVLLEGKPGKYETYIAQLNKWFSISLYSPEKEYFVSLVDNITARKDIEQKIKKLNTELEERVARRTEQLKKSNEELEAFSYSVSHDLRAPLRAIIGFTAILEEDYSSKLDMEAMRLTGVIKNNTLKMSNLIDDLLAFSRISRHNIDKTMIDTNEMVQQIITELEKKSIPGAIDWIIHPLSRVKGDINAIRQVWINLISNAAKYSANKSQQRIEIRSYFQNDQVVFLIKDNGAGFDEKYADKLFRVFQRLHSNNEFEGTGIGLAIVEKIISKHGGKVWAEGEVGKGANFYFSLPAGK